MFEYIKGIKKTLADTMSRLIDIDPLVQPESEPEGYEFGYYTDTSYIWFEKVQLLSSNLSLPEFFFGLMF